MTQRGRPPGAVGRPGIGALALALVLVLSGSAVARSAPDEQAYDGRFHFVRIRWGDDGRGGACVGRREPLWAHDMCRRGDAAENLFATILRETTAVDPHMKGKVLALDEPDLFRYPVAYIVEVGSWQPTQEEVEGLRAFLFKGGFLIVDDFRDAYELRNFHAQMTRVLGAVDLLPVEAGHRIWDSFFHIPNPAALAPSTYTQHVPSYLGIYEDNDPQGRMMAMINFNQDIGEYWEWSPDGFIPIPLTNEAYKFGVNYIIYAMTH
jgi:hypothetical protein